MLRFEMKEIQAGKLTIPGGWIAKVPEIGLEAKALTAYTSYVMKRESVMAEDAKAIVLDRHQGLYVYGFLTSLRAAVRYRARQYHKKYGTLDGFDPELMIRLWMPGENVGRRGKPFAITLMAEMAKSAREEP